jgi:hypothetical protein
MKSRAESLQGYNSIEGNDDGIKLLKGLKELIFKTHNVQYGYWTICQAVTRVQIQELTTSTNEGEMEFIEITDETVTASLNAVAHMVFSTEGFMTKFRSNRSKRA